jgi:hypothetical protein
MIEDIKTTPLNHPHTDVELRNQCKVIYGGVSWPNKRPGFAVVAGMLHEKHFSDHDIYLLAEFESFNTRELVRQCGAMDERYKPAMWIGDNKNSAADRFIRELDDELQSSAAPADRRSFYVNSTMMLGMNQLYAYMLPHLREQLEPDRKMLYLKESKILDYLGSIEEGQVAELQLGDFPAIEALAFAIITMRNDYPPQKPINLDAPRDTDESNLANSYITKSAFD